MSVSKTNIFLFFFFLWLLWIIWFLLTNHIITTKLNTISNTIEKQKNDFWKEKALSQLDELLTLHNYSSQDKEKELWLYQTYYNKYVVNNYKDLLLNEESQKKKKVLDISNFLINELYYLKDYITVKDIFEYSENEIYKK